jgi:hypothetical protein
MNQTSRAPFGITVLAILMLTAVAGQAHAMRGPQDKSIRSDEKVTLSGEDVVAKWPWLTTAVASATTACHSTTPCDPAYGACTTWSSSYDCGDPFCGVAANCGDPDCTVGPSLCLGPALRQKHEQFRVCFDQQSNSCTEYQVTSTPLACGC